MNMDAYNVPKCRRANIKITHLNIAKKRMPQLHAGGSLKSRILKYVVLKFVGLIEV